VVDFPASAGANRHGPGGGAAISEQWLAPHRRQERRRRPPPAADRALHERRELAAGVLTGERERTDGPLKGGRDLGRR
jgi:hypothetical protein